jgi:hypothetical protein
MARQRFFASHTLTQLAIWQHTAVAMANISDAVGAVARKDYAGASSLAQGAVREIEALLAAERRGEGGVWANWHLYDWLDGYSSLRDVLRQTESVVTAAAVAAAAGGDVGIEVGAPAVSVVQTRPFRFGTGSWNSFFQYETVPIHADGDRNFPFFNPHPDETAWSSFATAVRFKCAGECCADTVIGGNLNCSVTGAAGASVSLAAIGGLRLGEKIRYVLAEGSAAPAPSNASSEEYDAARLVSLHALACRPCSIAARVFSAEGKPLEPVTRATYNATY